MLLFKIWKMLLLQLVMLNIATSREWNGSSWGAGGDMEASMSSMSAAGTLSSAIYFGGYDDTSGVASYSSRSEIYNGTSWSDATSMRHNMMGSGTGRSTTDAIMCSGTTTTGSNNTGVSEELDGTTWTAGGTRNTVTTNGGAVGGITDCITMSGYGYAASNETVACESYNGTAWSAENDIGIASRYSSSWGTGTTGAWYYGGINYQSAYGNPTPHVVDRTPEYWNGTTWADDTQSPDAGGTSGGRYNTNVSAATVSNTGTQGAMIMGGLSYTERDTHAKLSTVWEANW